MKLYNIFSFILYYLCDIWRVFIIIYNYEICSCLCVFCLQVCVRICVYAYMYISVKHSHVHEYMKQKKKFNAYQVYNTSHNTSLHELKKSQP